LLPGETTVLLDDVTGLEEGDEILITATEFDFNQSEIMTILSVDSSANSVELTEGIAFLHYGGDDITVTTRIGDADLRAVVSKINRSI